MQVYYFERHYLSIQHVSELMKKSGGIAFDYMPSGTKEWTRIRYKTIRNFEKVAIKTILPDGESITEIQ
jgi:hypothetical protein